MRRVYPSNPSLTCLEKSTAFEMFEKLPLELLSETIGYVSYAHMLVRYVD